ncbi:MAG: type 3 dihydrofolate reductase [Gammaproteobacteria bacterium]|jgi:dihydrofolate reductase|nr:type 3 dihydrofolate reductase [Gammaproteobacteria bacterium]MDH3986842.1 type 3 dihydrofolate reductase [Gammaproteobacteria bacterium]
MKISIVVAMDANGVIGRGNELPWHLPADLQYFKKTTMGKPILMGRKTHESIGRPLPGRTNIVITRDSGYQAKGCVVVNSIDAAMQAAGEQDEIMVIGGAEFYRQVLAHTSTIYLTRIHASVDGDTVFPELNATDWREVERSDQSADEKNPYDYSFIRLERVTAA